MTLLHPEPHLSAAKVAAGAVAGLKPQPQQQLQGQAQQYKYIKTFEQVGMSDVHIVGGKVASLGEMIQHLGARGVRIPSGFAITTQGYRHFMTSNALTEKIQNLLASVTLEDKTQLRRVGAQIRSWIVDDAVLPQDLIAEISQAYDALNKRYSASSNASSDVDVAVRSSATAEDMPDASFAGQQDTFLNIRGLAQLLASLKHTYASLFNDRAISYRLDKGYIHADVALSIGVQKMVRSDRAASGVAFTLDTESGFRDVCFITSSYGLGENVVQGTVNPDEFYVHKPTLEQGFKPLLKKRLGSKAKTMVYAQTAEKK